MTPQTHNSAMKRASAITLIKRHQAALEKMGATSLYLFGSTARDAATPKSDIDIMIDYDPKTSFSLFDLMRMRAYISARLRAPVDLIPRDCFKPQIRKAVEKEAIKVF